MNFPRNPVAFLDEIVTRQKKWLRERPVVGESVRYMREAVDVQGRGQQFLEHYVYNPNPRFPDPTHTNCDLALLQLYEVWREKHNLRPIEAWDGTRLRPWLPATSNPNVPSHLSGSLRHFHDAYTRWRQDWNALDALGNAIESYFEDIRKHQVWSRPKGGGRLRLYRHNELNNIEVAPYSIRFWGFLKWADERRRTLLGENVPEYPHDEMSDIAFMDEFNQKHFPWHDDVFGNGECPSWQNQFGLKARHKYEMHTYGNGLEFLEFHGDLLAEYNTWLAKVGLPSTSEWRGGQDPWDPGIHHSAHILKQIGWAPWGIGGSNGKTLDPREYVTELYDPSLSAFDAASEMGAYFEGKMGVFFAFHGAGHVERCDIRDVYTNNYSVRFFHWHQWIDTEYKRLVGQLQKPKHFWNDPTRTLATPVPSAFFSKFKKRPEQKWPLTGEWVYRSFNGDDDWFSETDDHVEMAHWFTARLSLRQTEADNTVVIEGLLRGGYPGPDSPHYLYEVSGHLDQRNVHYELTPDWWEERSIIVMTARGQTEATKDHVYHYRGVLIPDWPDGKDQLRAIVGSVIRAERPDDRTLEGKVGSFIAIQKPDPTEGCPTDVATTTGLNVNDAINSRCPISGKSISADALLEYEGKVMGFCSKEHRDAVAASLTLLACDDEDQG